MLKTLGVTALALVALILWTPQADAATFTGTLTTSYGQPAINIGDGAVVKIEVPVQDYLLRPYFGWEVEAQGDLTDTQTLPCRFLQVIAGEQIYGIRDSIGGMGETVPTPPATIFETLDSMTGLLSYNNFDQAVLANVLPEVYYGSYTYLRLPLVEVDSNKLFPYVDKVVSVDGHIRYTEEGTAVIYPTKITFNGIEIAF